MTFSFTSKDLPDLMSLVSLCSNCAQPADKYCAKCNLPFCSLFCRTNDNNHTEDCSNQHKKIYEINTTDKSACKLPEIYEVPSKSIKSQSNVKLTCILNLRNVYVRPSDRIAEIEFNKLLNDVATEAKTAKYLAVAPKVGTLVLAPFEDIYHRGLVLKICNDSAVIAFIDFGNIEKLNINQLKIMSDDLKGRQRLVQKLILKNVSNELFNEKAMDYLAQFLLNNMKLQIMFDGIYVPHQTECELLTNKLADSVNKIISDLNSRQCILDDASSFNEYVSDK